MRDLEISNNMPTCGDEILSYGPIIVFRTQKHREIPEDRLKMEILYGWTPLLLSTAKCFTKLQCFFKEPIFAPFIDKLIVEGSDVILYTKSSKIRILGEKNGEIERKEINEEPVIFEDSVVNIFMADMKKFGEAVELHVTSKTIIYNETIRKISISPGSKLTIFNY
ncbi:unnamed protein product [Caenorhabditis angaria]|uniref:Uncharacterized protein n=1 Tax=Caenorhabditis angaria TaxID=860376 RepID=A0A9P1IHL0_9PELO|nr:unnamed protein product [Caenorhabditis angaria]